MEAELIKETVNTSYPSATLCLDILTEGEAIVPDTKPDISKVLFVEGRSVIEKTEIQNGRIIFTGSAEFTVLYTPDSGGVNSINAKIPFNHIEDCPNVTPEDKYRISSKTVHTECTLINSRKISLKGVISTNFTAYTDFALPVVTDIKANDVETKCEKTTFSRIKAFSEEVFTISDFLTTPSSQSPLETLLLCRCTINDTSFKIVTGKAVIKGSISVFQLYSSEEGRICHMQHDLPFTEIVDIPSLPDDSLCDISFSIKSYSINEDLSSDSDSQIFAFTADIVLSVIAFTSEEVDAITDAYIPGVNVKVTDSVYKKSEIISKDTLTLTMRESIDLPIDMPPMEQICPVSAYVTSVASIIDSGKISVKGTIYALITYLSSSDSPISVYGKEIPFETEISCPSGSFSVCTEATIDHSDYNFINQAKLDLRCILNLVVTLSKNTDSFPCINGVYIGDNIEKNRPSIVIYFVKSGDSLWDIAKKYNTTVEKIILANSIDTDEILNTGMRLLIPA